ncbi:hypothetical protein BDP55DRAFT_72351 [Colletotrichum godetiae]|uniref:Uncharacterized protein n=1 Tax=Colletotrichum godetiae TaxID=1209918 RepID=A0AAJ0AQN9_9PEZI|nr:uncharacterized protein BDP55DRAFT_72351 [Colletotrichum godetiae]KAK1687917.1 hypothetical protein BDP55DRAFT_72351 [Colletotrichum godetiae]
MSGRPFSSARDHCRGPSVKQRSYGREAAPRYRVDWRKESDGTQWVERKMGGRKEEENGRCELDRVGIDFCGQRREQGDNGLVPCHVLFGRWTRSMLVLVFVLVTTLSCLLPPLPRPSPAHPDPCSLPPWPPPQVRCIPRREVQNRFRRVADVAARAPSSSNHYSTWRLFGVVCVVCQVGFLPPLPQLFTACSKVPLIGMWR